MTVPRDSVVLTLFIQISLAIHTNPRAHPAMNLNTSQNNKPGHIGMSNNIPAAKTIPATMQRLRPTRTIARGYQGPHRITAIKLAAVTAPIAELE
jgi:hypothetical protein